MAKNKKLILFDKKKGLDVPFLHSLLSKSVLYRFDTFSKYLLTILSNCCWEFNSDICVYILEHIILYMFFNFKFNWHLIKILIQLLLVYNLLNIFSYI